MNAMSCGHLRLHFEMNPIAAFFPLLQKGFCIEIVTGNLQKILCRICDITPGEVRDRIQTVFLNGKPVDDVAAASVENGDCLALSAAMPGLVGATMRSGGVLAGFRHSISHRSSPTRSESRGGVLSIKLFNLLIKEIGPRVLRHGILVGPDDLRNLLTAILEDGRGNCKMAEWDAHPIGADALAGINWPEGPGLIRLEVTFGPSANSASPTIDFAENTG